MNLVGISRVDASSLPGPIGITLVLPNQGKPGDTVEIFGKGLANPSALTFYNGVATTVQTSTSTYIKTTVPTGAATGLLHVVTSLGQADSPSIFTVLSTTPLTLTPPNASVLPTRTVQFTASEAVTWSVELIPGGTTATGTISPTGPATTATYTAPGTGSFPRQVTVGAQSPGDPQRRAEAVVSIEPAPLTRAPRVTVRPADGPTQATPLRAKQVTLFVNQAPTQATPLRANRVTLERQPVITAVSPASLPQGAVNVPVTLTGQGLGSPTALQFLLNGTNDTNITYSNLTATGDGTQATATVSVTGTATIAGRIVQITAGGTTSTAAGAGTNVLQITGP